MSATFVENGDVSWVEGYLECFFFFFYPCDFDTSEIAIFEAFKVVVSSVSLFHVACWIAASVSCRETKVDGNVLLDVKCVQQLVQAQELNVSQLRSKKSSAVLPWETWYIDNLHKENTEYQPHLGVLKITLLKDLQTCSNVNLILQSQAFT